MLKVHHLGISQSDRVVWLCEELGLAYQLVRYDRDPVTRLAPDAYRALHPFGTAPVITDGDLVLGESGAIVEYLVHRHGGGRLWVAPDRPEYPDFLYWWHFANGSFMPAAMASLVATLQGGPPTAITAALAARTARAWEMVESRLARVPYFAGPEFTAADVLMLFPLTTMRAFVPHDLANAPHTRAYLNERIATRPAWQRATAKADPGFAVPLA